MHTLPRVRTAQSRPAHLRKQIGKNTAERRRLLGMSQEQLAAAVGYDRRWISSVERGRSSVRLEFLIRLAEALQLEDPLWLIRHHHG